MRRSDDEAAGIARLRRVWRRSQVQVLKQIWQGLQRVAQTVHRGVTWVLVALVFVLAVGPLSLWLRALGRSVLEPQQAGGSSFWLSRREVPLTLERFRKQF